MYSIRSFSWFSLLCHSIGFCGVRLKCHAWKEDYAILLSSRVVKLQMQLAWLAHSLIHLQALYSTPENPQQFLTCCRGSSLRNRASSNQKPPNTSLNQHGAAKTKYKSLGPPEWENMLQTSQKATSQGGKVYCWPTWEVICTWQRQKT